MSEYPEIQFEGRTVCIVSPEEIVELLEAMEKLAYAEKYSWANMVCLNHNSIERAMCVGHCPVCAETKANALQSSLAALEKIAEGLAERCNYAKRKFQLAYANSTSEIDTISTPYDDALTAHTTYLTERKAKSNE